MDLNWTFIGQTITFFVFVWFCRAYIWPPIVTAMRERQQTIADGLAAAEKADRDLEQAKEQVEVELQKAREEAQSIVEQARQTAAKMVEDARGEARSEGERLRDAARAEIDQEINRAKESLRSQVSALALAGAEKVLESSVDSQAHNAMLDRLAQEL